MTLNNKRNQTTWKWNRSNKLRTTNMGLYIPLLSGLGMNTYLHRRTPKSLDICFLNEILDTKDKGNKVCPVGTFSRLFSGHYAFRYFLGINYSMRLNEEWWRYWTGGMIASKHLFWEFPFCWNFTGRRSSPLNYYEISFHSLERILSANC